MLLYDDKYTEAKIADLGVSKYLVEGSLMAHTNRGAPAMLCCSGPEATCDGCRLTLHRTSMFQGAWLELGDAEGVQLHLLRRHACIHGARDVQRAGRGADKGSRRIQVCLTAVTRLACACLWWLLPD